MRLAQILVQASCAFDRAAQRTCCVIPAVPILFFGDLAAYLASPLRVLTVGKNPSKHEFPADRPFRRFPLAEGSLDREPSRYLDAMSAYFWTEPYRGWFSAFEQVLNGLEASYYEGTASTALHTDICSPVATNPTWSRLDEADQAALETDGGPLWHILLEELEPHIVVLSLAEEHLARIEFAPMTDSDWQVIHAFTRTGSGDLRSKPYEVRTRWYKIGGDRSLFAFGTAAEKPFGTLTNNKKRKTGKLMLQAYQDGR